ncbi:visual pigment-like receptor peropsin isoform X2 [Panonychus citri]|uniref:visual pigment-like receptor peropsin isoform X2 n=1 Tax=Panonychus citri TaxID=50023 RepID=UPI002306E24E|nr:visual pigment-like receptor peropsin isoform X2 [Panonychus citri]
MINSFPNLTKFIGLYLATVGIIGSICNLLLLFMFYRFRSRTSDTAILLANLALSDLGIVSFGNPFSSSSNLAGRWLYGDDGCQWYAFFGFFFGSAHIGTLTFLALDRYNKICRITISNPRVETSPYNIIAVILSIWLYALFWALMPMIGWASYGLEPLITSCTIDWRQNDDSYKSFIIVYAIFGYFLPFTIIFFSYRSVRRWINSRDPQVRWTNCLGDYWTNQKNITFMTIVINIAFLLAWTPYALLCLYVVFGDPADVPVWFSLLPPLMAKTSTIFNPLIYFLTNPRIRSAIWITLKCSDINQLDEEIENNHTNRDNSGETSTSCDKSRNENLIPLNA